ncbi:hypothetical protein Ahy_A09g043508 [Arachis hypogaea]|uniref:Uncharacterized protein n=1 Tax=Arachis hypogaea TaxID=3818 RepID=A0A445BIF8_ARAHY|nr:hypothetical protein Ahy_A09g043508 [Arachis hypogaea]
MDSSSEDEDQGTHECGSGSSKDTIPLPGRLWRSLLLQGHEYDEFVRAAKLDNEPEIYTAYGESAIVSILMFNEFSPVKHEKKVLEMIGRKLKKNNVALDIVNFGEEDEGKTEKLEALLAAVNNNDTSHIVHVPTGTNALSDVLISTPIFTGNGEGGSGFAAAAAAAAAGGVSGFEFGVDPNLDPELALALRVSMEEERARQEATTKKAAEEASKQEKGGEQQANSQDATMTERASASASEAETKTNDMMTENPSKNSSVITDGKSVGKFIVLGKWMENLQRENPSVTEIVEFKAKQ